MTDRNYWLNKISRQLERNNVYTAITTVPQLRREYPNISAAYPNLGLKELEEVYERLVVGDRIERPEKVIKAKEEQLLRRKLTIAEIKLMRSSGLSFRAIGQAAGISGERVRQLLNKEPIVID